MFQRLFAFLAFLLVTITAAHAERRIGLVMGIDTYPLLPQAAQLDKAIADARAIRDLLEKKLKFDHVVYAENPSLAESREVLLDFSRRLQPGDLAFVFFAGHGMNVRLANYLLPSDLPAPRNVTSEAQMRLEEESMIERAISEERIRELIAIAGARAAIVVLDACRNNIFREALAAAGPRTRSLAAATSVQGPRPVERSQGGGRTQFLTLYSASPGQRALDSLGPNDKHPNSPFTRILLEQLPTPGLKAYEVMRRLRADVVRLARRVGHEQVPAISDEVLDEVILMPGARPVDSGGAGAARPQSSGPRVAAAERPLPPPTPAQPVAAPPRAANAPAPSPSSHGGQQGTAVHADGARAGQSFEGWRLSLKSRNGLFVSAAALAPNNSIIAAGYRDGSLRLWSADTARLDKVITVPRGPPERLAFDVSSQQLASVGKTGVDVWSATAGQRLRAIEMGKERVSDVAFTPDARGLVVREARGTIRRFDLATGQEGVATPEDQALVDRRRSSQRRRGANATIAGPAVRFDPTGSHKNVLSFIVLARGAWVAIDGDGLTFTGDVKALDDFELVKGRDRLTVSAAFIQAHQRSRLSPK